MTLDPQSLEHRLTTIEGVVKETRELVRTQNGQMTEHMKQDEAWMRSHDIRTAHDSGFRSGIFWIVGLVTAGFTFLASLAAKLLTG